jgi:hypothetical protein
MLMLMLLLLWLLLLPLLSDEKGVESDWYA